MPKSKKKAKTCPICGGVGYVRRDLPVDHPDFGRLEVCDCQKESVQRDSVQRLFEVSNLGAFKEMIDGRLRHRENPSRSGSGK